MKPSAMVLTPITAPITALVLTASASFADPLPSFADIPGDERFPLTAAPALSTVPASFGDGALLVEGKPRFIIGTTFFEGADRDPEVSTTGYAADQRWIYESLPDYADAQRLGLDAFGATPPRNWRRIFRPRPVPRRNMNLLGRPLRSGLPILAELAIEPGTHAWMTLMEGVNPPEGAWFEGPSHGIPYSVVHEDGIASWDTIWRIDSEYYRDLGVRPFAWRIFAGADFFDTSRRNASLFIRWLEARWKTASDLNRALGTSFATFSAAARVDKGKAHVALTVEYLKFLESCFARQCARAVEVVRDASGDPAPGVCFQPLRVDGAGVDILQAAATHPLLCAPATNATPRYDALFMQAVAQGRPVFSPPVVPAGDAEAVRGAILAQFARGYAVAFLEHWRRQPRDWVKYTRPATGESASTRLDEAATEAAGRRYAAEHPGAFMNPYALAPDALAGIRLAKRDALAAADLFAFANRTNNPAVALLHSRPSVRLAHARDDLDPLAALPRFADAIVFAQFTPAVVLEEQLANLDATHHPALVVPDACAATYPETPDHLRRYAEHGGTLVVATGAIELDEYGAPATNVLALAATNGWTRSAIGGATVSVMNVGSGRVVTLPRDFGGTNLVAALGALLDGLGAPRAWQGLDPATGARLDGIEGVHARAPDGRHGLILINETDAPISALVKIPGLETPRAADLRGGPAPEPRDGGVQVTLKPGCPEIIALSSP